MDNNEKQIIVMCQNGHLEEFCKLYDKYFNKIYSFIYFKTLRKEVAEDITSQTFISALEKIQTFKFHKGTFSAWLYRIARNKIIDTYRAKHNHIDISNAWNLSSKENVHLSTGIKDDFEKVMTVLNKLKPIQREIVLMRIWDGLSHKEIAQIIGKSESNCKMIFSRTIKKLRKDKTLALLAVLLLIIKI